ncbi:TadE family protein [Solidesulfovibrio fructosivorans JJ]]|uniref:TadE family protein n=1 Tax=Solidesulfovibrio fructosivorans JJ] TaxID=596151 RepID=E1JZK1_SOLFR|nr:TadE/TadG family type IV pilus assembly protein [Solidesulfovibrio fructosivorans]EFL50248.1 TadE family protein [Solidesulfovibrio fructosivorans JJ]]
MRTQPLRNQRVSRRRESGATAVEFALVLPVLVFMLLGIIEVANILRIQFTLESAATTVAHDISQNPNITNQSAAQNLFDGKQDSYAPLVQQGRDTSDPSDPPALAMSPTTRPTCNSSSCTPFLITITYTYKAMTAPMQPFFDGLTLSASARKSPEPNTSTALAAQ